MTVTKRTAEKPISERSVRKTLMLAVQPLFEVIEKHSRALERECLRAFEKTGFSYPDYDFENLSKEELAAQNGWEILPYQYVQSKLFSLHDLMGNVHAAIRRGSVAEISESLRVLQETSAAAFAEVEEFLSSPLSRLTKAEWERLSSWSDWVESPSFNWSIGSVPMLLNPDKDGAYSCGDDICSL